MTDIQLIPLPQMGANDTHAVIIEWLRGSGEEVRAGEIVCTAETTKSIFDIEAPADGYLTHLVPVGAEVPVGEHLAAITREPSTADQIRARTAPRVEVVPVEPPSGKNGLDWTVKAEMTARRHGLDIHQVPSSGAKITEADVLSYIESRSEQSAETPAARKRDLVNDGYRAGRVERILIVGGGQGAVQVLDVISRTRGQQAVAIVDDNPDLAGVSVAGVPVIGPIDREKIVEMYRNGEFDAAINSVSTSNPFRERLMREWREAGIRFANVIHPTAQIGMNVSIGEGNIILAFCHIGPCATIGDGNFLSPYCSIEHHSVLGNCCSFGPAVATSGSVTIGDRSKFGTGIYLEPHVKIGADSIIGSGCIIRTDVPERSVLKSKINYSVRRRP